MKIDMKSKFEYEERERKERERKYYDMIAEKRRCEEEDERRHLEMERSLGITVPMSPRSPDPPM